MVMVNDGDRPIQVGSHLHLPASNPALSFDRDQAEGFRLDIPAGTSMLFEPGVSRTVELVALGGRRQVPGLQIRSHDRQIPTADGRPAQAVAFGTPGTDTATPRRAKTTPARISDTPADSPDAPSGSESRGRQDPP